MKPNEDPPPDCAADELLLPTIDSTENDANRLKVGVNKNDPQPRSVNQRLSPKKRLYKKLAWTFGCPLLLLAVVGGLLCANNLNATEPDDAISTGRHRRHRNNQRSGSNNQGGVLTPLAATYPPGLAQFEGPPDTNVPNVQRLRPVMHESGRTGTAFATVKKCAKPYRALMNVGEGVLKSCALQALARLYGNTCCWDEEFRECNDRNDCRNAEVERIHTLLSNQGNGLADYMDERNYTRNNFLNELTVIPNSLFDISRNDPETDAVLTHLGEKFNLRLRHFVELPGSRQGPMLHTWVAYVPVLEYATEPRKDFTPRDALVKAIFGGNKQYCPSSQFGAGFVKRLNRPSDEREDYYARKKLKVHVHETTSQVRSTGTKGTSTEVIPEIVTRLVLRFQNVKKGQDAYRTLPEKFTNNKRTFYLQSLIVHNEEQSHVFNLVIKRKNANFECWKLDSGFVPGLQPKARCTRERILYAAYCARDPQWTYDP